MYVGLGIARAVVTAVAAALLAMIAVWLVLRSTKNKASLPRGWDYLTLRFSAALDKRCKVLIGVGVAWAVLFVPFVPFGFREGWWAFPLMILAIRRRMLGYALHVDSKRLFHEPLRPGARTLYWARLASVRLAGDWLVLTDVFKSEVRVSRYLDGLGALARYIDDQAPPMVEIDGRARELLLDCYRRGLVEADENPDRWFAARSGPLSRHVKKASQPGDDGLGVIRARNRTQA
jgi:hypothetical protein